MIIHIVHFALVWKQSKTGFTWRCQSALPFSILTLWNAHFELRSVHMIAKYVRILSLCIIHASDRKCDSPFESVEKRHGCVWVACFSNMHQSSCLGFLCMCSAWYQRVSEMVSRSHKFRHPNSRLLRSSHAYTDSRCRAVRGFFLSWKHLCTVIWLFFHCYFYV